MASPGKRFEVQSSFVNFVATKVLSLLSRHCVVRNTVSTLTTHGHIWRSTSTSLYSRNLGNSFLDEDDLGRQSKHNIFVSD
jgi:hypothetical protein